MSTAAGAPAPAPRTIKLTLGSSVARVAAAAAPSAGSKRVRDAAPSDGPAPMKRGRGAVNYAELDMGMASFGTFFGQDALTFKHAVLTLRTARVCACLGRCTCASPREAFHIHSGHDFTLDWVRHHGLRLPVCIREKEGLGLMMPGPAFTVMDVADAVGHAAPVEVMDVATQMELSGWNLKSWAEYFHRAPDRRDAILNVISLEVSGTPLEAAVRSPALVRDLDWIDGVWPGARRAGGEFPAVQLYCLMSVAGSYTDFHIDFGGTSVWYHVHTGRKVFIFAPPSDANLARYEAWTTSRAQNETFFGDLAQGTFRVELTAGNTLIIPTGWIHAVYTPEDSLVFGGNFLHGLDMCGQLRIYQVENYTRVPRKYRFPHYEAMHWYAAAYYLNFARLPAFPSLLSRAVAAALASAPATVLVERTDDDAMQIAAVGVAALATQLYNDTAPAQVALRVSRLMADGVAGAHAAAAALRSHAPPGREDSVTAITRELHAIGLSWAEITGLHALVASLALMQQRESEEKALAAQDSAATSPTATGHRLRVKGARDGGVVHAGALTQEVAAAEAAAMVCCATPEEMLCELAARIDAEHPEGVGIYGTKPSVLWMHGDGSGEPPPHALASFGGHNRPKGDILYSHARSEAGGFGLRNGTLRRAQEPPFEISLAGAGYEYNVEEQAGARGADEEFEGEDEEEDAASASSGSDSGVDEAELQDEVRDLMDTTGVDESEEDVEDVLDEPVSDEEDQEGDNDPDDDEDDEGRAAERRKRSSGGGTRASSGKGSKRPGSSNPRTDAEREMFQRVRGGAKAGRGRPQGSVSDLSLHAMRGGRGGRGAAGGARGKLSTAVRLLTPGAAAAAVLPPAPITVAPVARSVDAVASFGGSRTARVAMDDVLDLSLPIGRPGDAAAPSIARAHVLHTAAAAATASNTRHGTGALAFEDVVVDDDDDEEDDHAAAAAAADVHQNNRREPEAAAFAEDDDEEVDAVAEGEEEEEERGVMDDDANPVFVPLLARAGQVAAPLEDVEQPAPAPVPPVAAPVPAPAAAAMPSTAGGPMSAMAARLSQLRSRQAAFTS